jgi:choline-sulfatase
MRILYLDIDSCRADHLGCYGYARATSPVVDELADQGALLRACHPSDTPCLPSRAALSSGRFGVNNGVTCHDGPAAQLRYAGRGHFHDPTRPLWMRVLQEAGWDTVCFSGFGQRHLAWWFAAGFTQNFGNQLPGGAESADQVNEKAIPWLRANGTNDDWFMHITYWDVHTPYHAPRAYYDRVGDASLPHFPNEEAIADDARHYYGPRTARDWWHATNWRNPRTGRTSAMPDGNPDNLERYAGFLNGYDAGIAYADANIGALLEEIERLGIRDETAIIIGADHGEAIGELGMYFEHGNCTEGVTRVPLIVQWPGVTDRTTTVIDTLTYQLDLPPTVLDLLGIQVPSGWDGTSFAPRLRGDEAAPGRSHLVLGTGIYSFQRAVRTPRYRLVRTIHSGLYPYDPLYLFDMDADPHERHNIASSCPDVVAELDHLLLEWTYRYTTGPAGERDPFQEQLRMGVTPDLYCPRERIEARLTDLGREDQLNDLRRRRDLEPSPRPW